MTEVLEISDVAQAAAAHAQTVEEARSQQLGAMTQILQANFTTIMVTLEGLTKEQKGTNEHLKILNGKVATQEGNINTLLLWKARIEGFNGAVNLGWTSVLALSGAVVALLIYWLTGR